MKPARTPRRRRKVCIKPKKTWLQTKVPALCETEAGRPASRSAATMALMGRLLK
jgi:hypothetical protein